MDTIYGLFRGTPGTTPPGTAPTTPRKAASGDEGDAEATGRPDVFQSAEASAEICQWEVIWPSGVHVRQSKNTKSESLGVRGKGTVVAGREEDSWVALSEEAGFMFIGDGKYTLLQKTEAEVSYQLIRTSPQIIDSPLSATSSFKAPAPVASAEKIPYLLTTKAVVEAPPQVPDSPLLSAVPEPSVPPSRMLSPRSAPLSPVPDGTALQNLTSTALASALSNPAPPGRPTSSLRSRSGPPSPREQLALATCVPANTDGLARQRLLVGRARGKVDQVMNDMADVRSRLGAQESRLFSLTRSLQDLSEEPPAFGDARERGRQAGSPSNTSRATSSSLKPEAHSLFSAMVEEMQHISELAARGEQASRDVEEVKTHLGNLCSETNVLSLAGDVQPPMSLSDDQIGRLLQLFRSELADAVQTLRQQDIRTLRRDLDTLKEKFVAEATASSSDATALRGVLADTVGTLRSELCQLAGQGEALVLREDLAAQLNEAMLQMRRDMAESLSVAVESLRESLYQEAATGRGTGSPSTAALSNSEANLDLATAVSDLRARLDKAAGDALDARRGLDSLQEDLAVFQTSKMVTQQELSKTTEFLSKEFRLLLDMTMHNFHSTTRQEMAQSSSQLRRELRPLADFGENEGAATLREVKEAVEQLRQEVDTVKDAKNGDPEASRRWPELVNVVENLLEDVAQLGEKTSRSEKTAAAELAQARQTLTGLIEDVGILKAQRRLQGEEARLEKDDIQQLILKQQQSAFEGLVTRRELEDVANDIRRELVVIVNGKHQSEATAQNAAGMNMELVAETQHVLARLSEDVAYLKVRHGVMGEEAARDKVAMEQSVEQRVRVVRQELITAIEELRALLPAAAAVTSRVTSPTTSVWPNSSAAIQHPVAHAGLLGRDMLDTEKDFGNLRDDLNSLKNRQEFLKQELKCLVDTASRS